MAKDIKYWLVFVEGMKDDGRKFQFPMTYKGKKILWEYLLETVEEDYELKAVRFNGHIEITQQKYNELHMEE